MTVLVSSGGRSIEVDPTQQPIPTAAVCAFSALAVASTPRGARDALAVLSGLRNDLFCAPVFTEEHEAAAAILTTAMEDIVLTTAGIVPASWA